MADLFIRTETPASNGDSLIVHTEGSSEILAEVPEVLYQSLRDSVAWYLEQWGVTATGDTQYVIIEMDSGPPAAVIERGVL